MYIYIYRYCIEIHIYFHSFVDVSPEFPTHFSLCYVNHSFTPRWSPDIVGLGELAKALEVEWEVGEILPCCRPEN